MRISSGNNKRNDRLKWACQAGVLSVALYALTACGGFSPAPNVTTGLTGKTHDKSGAPYTANDQRVEDFKKEWIKDSQINLDTTADVSFAESITFFTFRTFNKDSKQSLVQPVTYEAQVKLLVNGQEQTLGFNGSINPEGPGAHIAARYSEGSEEYLLVGDCEDRGCAQRVELQLKKRNLKDKGKVLSRAKLFGRGFWTDASIRLNRLEDQNGFSDGLKRRVKKYQNIKSGWNTNWSVAPKGISFYEIRVFGQKSEDAKLKTSDSSIQSLSQLPEREASENLEYLLTIRGDSVRTNDHVFPVEIIDSSDEQPVTIELQGNSEDHDLKTFSVTLVEEGIASEFLVEFTGDTPVEMQIESNELLGMSEESFLKAPYSDKFPQTKAIIDDVEKNFGLPGVQTWIKKWSGENSDGDLMRDFFYYGAPLKPYIEAIYQHHDVPAPLTAIILNESPEYFRDGKYLIDNNPNSTAKGPHQFLKKIGKSFGMKISKDYDERDYFVPSNCAAAELFDEHYDYLKNKGVSDSTMIMLTYKIGYHGAGGLAYCLRESQSSQTDDCWNDKKETIESIGRLKGREARDAMKALRRYDFSFREIVERHMLDSANLGYMNKMLAAWFVNGRPNAHGIILEEVGAHSERPANMVGPKKINDKQCRKAVKDLL